MTLKLSLRGDLRLVVGFALTPLAAGFLAFAAYAVLWTFSPTSGFRTANAISGAVGMGLSAGIVAVFVIVFGAIPAFAWVSRVGPPSLAKVLFAGALLGNLPLGIGVLLMLGSHLRNGTIPPNFSDQWYGLAGLSQTVAVGLFVGMTSAAVFWLIGISGTEPATIETRTDHV
jgi:hypothetical protein